MTQIILFVFYVNPILVPAKINYLPRRKRGKLLEFCYPQSSEYHKTMWLWMIITYIVFLKYILGKLNPLRARWPIEPALIPGSCSVKWMRVFDSPWMGH